MTIMYTTGQSTEALDLVVEDLELKKVESGATHFVETAVQQSVAETLDAPVPIRKRWMRRYRLLLVCADSAAGLIAASTAYAFRHEVSVQRLKAGFFGDRISYPELAVLSLMAWLTMLAVSGAYRGKHLTTDARDYGVPVVSALRLMAAFALGSYLFHSDLSRVVVGLFFVTLAASALLCRGMVNLALRHARRRGRAQARILLVGEHRPLRDFAEHLLRPADHSCNVVAVCASKAEGVITVRGRPLPLLGTPDDVLQVAVDVAADAVVVSNPTGLSKLTLQQVAWQLERSGIDLLVAPDVVSLAGPRIRVGALRGVPVLHVSHPRHESLLRNVHFAVSRFLGACLLVVTTPVLLAVALAVKLGSPGPVLYRQKRVGYKGEEFHMLKFRSMVVDAEARLESLLAANEHDGALFKMREDPRVTRVGRVIRKYSLDELPQLLNVVKGDMTLVGPRPCLAREITRFGEAEHRRFMVRPGMTGLWQVTGGPNLPWADAVKTDLYYVDNWSPALDVSILARTVRVVLTGRGC